MSEGFCRELASLPFMESVPDGDGVYRIRGTSYLYFRDESIWALEDSSGWYFIPFEEVFEGVSEAIRDEIIFHLDLFR
jgi:hypothetical protein